MIQQATLFENPTLPKFDGAAYVETLDRDRLAGQIKRIYDIMSDGKWRSVSAIREASLRMFEAYDSETSISAQLRNLRKARFGGHTVEMRRATDGGLHEYRLVI